MPIIYKKIAFLFLIYGKIDHEDIWHDFFLQDTQNRYSIYIHYKYDKKLRFLEKFKIQNCVKTLWGNISIVKAQNLLLQEAIKDDLNVHFVFLSGTCVPLKTFEYVYRFFNKNCEYSYFNMRPDKSCFPRCKNALNFIDIKYIKKASQWCILSRRHAEILLRSKEYFEWFKDTVGDEHCYISYLYYLGLSDEIIKTYDSAEKATTFTNWPGISYKYYNSDKTDTLKNYTSITKEELLYLVNSPCLFGRKFLAQCDLSLLKQLLNCMATHKPRRTTFIANSMEVNRC